MIRCEESGEKQSIVLIIFKHFFVNVVFLIFEKMRKITGSSAFEFLKSLKKKKKKKMNKWIMAFFQPIAPIGPQT